MVHISNNNCILVMHQNLGSTIFFGFSSTCIPMHLTTEGRTVLSSHCVGRCCVNFHTRFCQAFLLHRPLTPALFGRISFCIIEFPRGNEARRATEHLPAEQECRVDTNTIMLSYLRKMQQPYVPRKTEVVHLMHLLKKWRLTRIFQLSCVQLFQNMVKSKQTSSIGCVGIAIEYNTNSKLGISAD